MALCFLNAIYLRSEPFFVVVKLIEGEPQQNTTDEKYAALSVKVLIVSQSCTYIVMLAEVLVQCLRGDVLSP